VVRDLGRDGPWPEHGTVLLQNVDDLPDDLQRKLHRSLSAVPDGVRLVSTASADGRKAVSDGRLRAELYYALAVIVAQVPPLRARQEDIVPLFELALAWTSTRYGRPCPTVDAHMADVLTAQAWPGNVREVFNLAERAVVMGYDSLDFEPPPKPDTSVPALEEGFSLSEYLEGIERRVLVEALRQAGGDRNMAGRLLGVERNTLRYKLNKYGLLDR
jgi:DNA-binding NtrC family response regulator